MQQLDGRFVFAASDLNNYLECAYLTHLDHRVALGELPAPQREDPSAELIARKGDEHEQRYLAELRQRSPGGVTVFQRPEHSIAGFEAAEAATVAAMERGDPLIYQATFFDGQFLGHPDFLRRVEKPCARFPWSYEVIDTKLALNPKPYFILQICNYSEHLARIQGTAPEFGYIVLGNGEELRYRLHDFTAYYRRVKQRFLSDPQTGGYPHKNAHCPMCKWHDVCARQREGDDHLSLVATMRRTQIERLNGAGIASVVDLAGARDHDRPAGMNPDTFGKLRRQALMQVRGRTEGPVFDHIEHEPWNGFGLLPEPAAGDVFFDMEGDPLYEPARGLEYLFGLWLPDDEQKFKAFWALDRSEEKRAFEQFVDFIAERRRRYPELHIYHYADYERSALRRLAQAHGTREREVDDFLRAEIFVDLYAVVRQSLVISESSYSIKRLEKFYDLKRSTGVKKGDDSIVMFEQWLADRSRRDILEDIERYNADDCRSTHLLRDWLLERRKEAIALGRDIAFHTAKVVCHETAQEGCKDCTDRRKRELEEERTTQTQRRLLDGILSPQSGSELAIMREDLRARYLLANLLAYHRREETPVWWAFFDRLENADRLLEFDKDSLAGLTLDRSAEPYKHNSKDKNLVYTYAFPDQMHKLGPGDTVHDPATQKTAGEIVALDDDCNIVALKRAGSIEDAAAVNALIPGGPLPAREQKAALERIAQAYLARTLSGPTLDLLLGRNPSFGDARRAVQPPEVTPESVSEAVRALNRSYLFIQGPPGSGKTTVGARVICDLLATGKRVGVLSTGHKAIHNLLHKVEECASKRGFTFAGLYKHSSSTTGSEYVSKLSEPMIASVAKNEAFESGGYALVGGTSWLFSRPALVDTLDYLFIDEAGQVSLADAIAVSAAARNVVLLGDPVQLAQVSQGSHPIGAGTSVLRHLLGEAQTIPEDRGIFLDRSFRMHPEICRFISDTMYDGRLKAAPETATRSVRGSALSGSGLRFIPVVHHGNGRESREEADSIAAHIVQLLEAGLSSDKIIIVTPYNAQRRLIAKVLREAEIDVRVGTVDKFQGQEAAVVFYSMATSSGAEIPRDMEFLFEKNRFNVAISRAQALAVVVCSEELLNVRCRTVDQIASVNVICSFVEAAERVEPAIPVSGASAKTPAIP